MSKAIATTRSIERTSARNIRTVDVGALSSAKTQLTLTQTSGRTQARFAKRGSGFCLGAVTQGSAVAPGGFAGQPTGGLIRWATKASASVRLAHRRWAAGSPAAVAALGSCKPRKTVYHH